MTTKKQTYRIAGETIVDKFNGVPVNPGPCTGNSDFRVFRAISGMVAPDEKLHGDFHPRFEPEGAEIEYLGNRKLGNVKTDSFSGWGRGYAFIDGNQTRIEIIPMTILGKPDRIGIITSPASAFLAPFPLEDEADADKWFLVGYNGDMSVNQWRKALQWRGIGSKEAAEDVKARWCALRLKIRRFALPDIPAVIFPGPKQPVEAIPPDIVERMKEAENDIDRIMADMEAMRAAMEAMQAKIAVLEFQP